jgi:hypothetical protein
MANISTQVQESDKIIERIVYALAVAQFFWGIIGVMLRYIFARTTTDIKQLFDFHNKREDECKRCLERLSAIEAELKNK